MLPETQIVILKFDRLILLEFITAGFVLDLNRDY
jgi:hypothetical protein